MKHMLMMMGLFLFVAPSVAGQERPKVGVFGGYSYARLEAGQERINTNGWHAQFAVSTKYAWMDVVGDVSGVYGSLKGVDVDAHTVLFGIRSSVRRERLTPFVHFMFGLSLARADAEVLGGGIEGRSDASFAFVPGGGGLDIKLSDRVAFRAFQFDLVFTRWGSSNAQFHPRLATGLVFHFGKK